MTLDVIRRWYSRLPPAERDLPIVIYQGVAYTPTMIYSEVMRGTPLGEILQRYVETGSIGTTREEEYMLALTRLREVLRRYSPDRPIIATLTIPPRTLTPSDILREVESRTPLGMRFVEAELEHARRLLRLR